MILTNIEPPSTGIRLEDNLTRLYVDNENKGTGTLYVTEGDIRWLNTSGEGVILNYKEISVFAICTDREKYEEDCLFLLVEDEKAVSDEDDELDIDYSSESELRLVPSDGVSVHDLFRVVQECNKLHIDENDVLVSDDSEDDDRDSGDASMAMNGNNGDHIPGQFDDVE